MTRLSAIAVVAAAAPSVAHAHPGHGAGGGSFGVLHYLAEPIHAVVLATVALFVLSVIWAGRRSRVARQRR